MVSSCFESRKGGKRGNDFSFISNRGSGEREKERERKLKTKSKISKNIQGISPSGGSPQVAAIQASMVAFPPSVHRAQGPAVWIQLLRQAGGGTSFACADVVLARERVRARPRLRPRPKVRVEGWGRGFGSCMIVGGWIGLDWIGWCRGEWISLVIGK